MAMRVTETAVRSESVAPVIYFCPAHSYALARVLQPIVIALGDSQLNESPDPA
jgi:hypothetical protein